MDSEITKKELAHLARLARLELNAEEEGCLLRDLREIVAHVGTLSEADTAGVEPMSGGTLLTNRFRNDDASSDTNQRKGVELFPDTERGYLKIPPVFTHDTE